ncbi:ornithine aminotransferase [Ilyonectria destructans]|nr:ornithine aminotransferase [Ilyonectria destructans]
MPSVNLTASKRTLRVTDSGRELYQLTEQYSVGGINSLPLYFESGKGSRLIDSAGNELIDFICGFSASNLGQCHPRIVEAQVKSAQNITLANIAGMSAAWPPLAKRLCEKFGYDKVTAMTSGAEAADTACKLARGWGISAKKINPADVLVLGTSDNYHGTISGVWPLMEREAGWELYGTFSSNVTNTNPKTGKTLRYLYAEDYAEVFDQIHERIAAVIIEPLHGTSRSMDEEIDFCVKVRQLCKKYNILYIADEVRMGSCKTGKVLSSDWLGPENKPDIIVMGKSISGGAYPALFVLGPEEVMANFKPYHSLSTYSMTSMACAVVQASLDVWEQENLTRRARDIHAEWAKEISSWKFPYLKYATAFGADMNLFLDEEYADREEKITPRRFMLLCASKGLLVYPAPGGRVRMGVAMTISDGDLRKGFSIVKEALEELPLYGEIELDEQWAGGF